MKNVAIMMAVGGYEDKVPPLSNVLYSIKKQNGIGDHNIKLCFFLDGCNKYQKNNLVQTVNNFFDSDQALYSESDKPVGFQCLYRNLAKMIPDETDILIHQSCDVIWYNRDILMTMIENIEHENSAFSCSTINRFVDKDLFKMDDDADGQFHRELDRIVADPQPGVQRKKHHRFLFLGGMRPDTFRGIGALPFACDIIQQQWLAENGFVIRELKENPAIHQEHPKSQHHCSSVPVCPDEYKCNRKGSSHDEIQGAFDNVRLKLRVLEQKMNRDDPTRRPQDPDRISVPVSTYNGATPEQIQNAKTRAKNKKKKQNKRKKQ